MRCGGGRGRAILLALGLQAAGGAAAAPPLETGWVGGPEGRLRLVAGGGTGGIRWLGATFDLAPGWKIFWRSPGAPGLPPVLDWRGSRNLASARIVWPAPVPFASFGFTARGYGGRVTLPVRAAVRDPARPLNARVHVRYQLCREVCIPAEARLALTVPAGARPHPAIEAARARVPAPAGAGFAVWQAVQHGRRVTVRIRHRSRALPAPLILVEAPAGVPLGRTRRLAPDRAGRVGVALPILGTGAVPERFPVRITLIAGGRAWEKTVTVLPAPGR